MTPLTFFIAFLCINIFQNSKIGNILKKNLNKKKKILNIFLEKFFDRNVIFEKLKSFEKVFELKIKGFLDKNAKYLIKNRGFLQFFWKFSENTGF